MRPNLHGGSIRRPLRTSYIVVGTRRRPPSPKATCKNCPEIPECRGANHHSRPGSIDHHKSTYPPSTGAKELYDFHISSDQPAHQARLLRTTLNSLVEQTIRPTN